MATMGKEAAEQRARSSLRVQADIDILAARSAVRRCAESLGFTAKDVAELVIVVSELGSNILKYAVRGEIAVERIEDSGAGAGIRIIARDEGPPFHDLSLALLDGYGDRGPVLPERLLGRKGIGSGLGAVVRFTDSFECEQRTGEKAITVIRYRRRPKPKKTAAGL